MPKWYISDSTISGKGVFAKKSIRRGEIAFILKGPIRNFVVTNKKDALAFPNWIGIAEGQWIDPKKPANYINHSCEPNLGIRGRVLFVALKDIKKDEELTFDYSITEEGDWEMECLCGKARCRSAIGSIHSLPFSIYKKYLPFVPKYFQKVYTKEGIQK